MSFGKFEKKEIIDIISCSWSPYWLKPGGPEGAVQFNSASIFSGSSNFVYDYSQSILSLEGDLIVHGNITAEQYILSSSVLYYTTSYFSGSTKFGDTLDDTHQFTGSVYITGSSYLIGNSTITGSMYMRSGSIVMTGPTASITGVDYIDFDNQYTIGTNEPAWKEGRLFYDSGSGGLAFYNWEQDVTLNIGQEQWLRARNQTGVTITNGSVVKLSSAIGDRPTIVLAQAIDQTNTFSVDNDIIGMATHDIETGTDGFVTTFGLVNGVNTNAFNAGDLLWVSQSAGQYTNVPPGPPYDKLFVGVVTRKNANNGTIFVTPQQSIHFHDISSVSASLYTQGDIWMYKITGSSGVWTNTKTLSGSYVISGSLNVVNGITGSLYGTASYAITASRSISSSYAISASYSISSSYSFSSSYAISSSYSFSSSYAISASYSFSSSYAISSSFAISSSRAVTASFATTASYVNLLAGPNITINYLSTGIAITGSGGGSSITFYNGNTNVLHTSTLTGIYVTGSGITTTNNSGNVTMSFSTGSSGGSAISFYSGSTLLTSNLSSLRITGSGVTATVNASNGVTMSFSSSSGGGGGSAISFYSGSTLLTSNLTTLYITGSGITATSPSAGIVSMSFTAGSGSGGSAITVTKDGTTLTTNLTKLNFNGDFIGGTTGTDVTITYYDQQILASNSGYIDTGMVTDRFYYGTQFEGWNGGRWDVASSNGWTSANPIELSGGKSDYNCGVVLHTSVTDQYNIEVCGLASCAQPFNPTKALRVGIGYLTCDNINAGVTAVTMLASGSFNVTDPSVPGPGADSVVCGWSLDVPFVTAAACETYIFVGIGVGEDPLAPVSFTYTIKLYVKP